MQTIAKLLLWLIEGLMRVLEINEQELKPEPPKVRAICHRCGDFHDGPYRYCEACIQTVSPPFEVEECVTAQVDAVEWEVR